MSWARPRSLRTRLALWYALVMSAVLIVFSLAIYFFVAQDEERESATAPSGGAHEAPDLAPRRLLVTLGLGLPVAVVVAISGGLYITRRALEPLNDVVRTAGELNLDNLAARVPTDPRFPEETQRLISSLNAMIARLERSVGGMRRFTADASHELRTPIALLMGQIEVTLRRPREPVELRSQLEETLEELGRLSRLVDSLLLLARSDNGELPLERVQLDAAKITREVLEPYEAVMAQRNILLAWVGAPAQVLADALWLGRAVANLIDNACKFTPDGGRIEVSVSTTGAYVDIVVRDSGPGLTVTDRERAFERFYRGEAVRGNSEGFGLGLALAHDIVRGLGGELLAESAADTGGQFRIRLPSANAVSVGS